MRIEMVPLTLVAALVACPLSPAMAASSPEALARDLQKALQSGDMKAARKLAAIERAPAELHFFYFDQVRECATEATCTTSLAPIDDDYRASLKQQAREAGAEPVEPAGLVVVSTKSRDGSGSGSMKMPYAEVGGEYRLASMGYSDAEFARRRATTSEQLMQEMLAAGVYDSAKGERRTDWVQVATRLPADGGEPGRAFVRQASAMAAAVDARDPDAAMRAGGTWARMVFADKSHDGKPIAKNLRQGKLEVQALRMLRDVKLQGGYQLGDDAVLMIEARNGIGWTERGAVLVSRDGDAWELAGRHTVAYP